MLAHFEERKYDGKERVWVGRYRNLNNLPHWHLVHELIYVEQGEADVSHSHENYTLNQGDAIFISSSEVHYIKSTEDTIICIFMFEPAITAPLTGVKQLSSAKLSGQYPIPDIYQTIRQELKARQPFYDLKGREELLSLMIDIFRGEETCEPGSQNEPAVIANYKALLNDIEKKYSYITFSDAAACMGLSQPYFSRLFKKLSGMTFSQYLNIVRLEHAIDMLHHNPGGRTITEIAISCGFETIRHFNRTFRQITGMSPRELPAGYTLDIQPILSIQEAFNPTLQSSELL